MRILGISGSLSTTSANATLLSLIGDLLGDEVDFSIYNGIGQLPHFNPETDIQPANTEVQRFRDELKDADAIIVCTPEYAFGVPGSLKNALDWTVSSGELVNKPVALITASLSGEKAQAALLQTFTALSINIVPQRILLLSFIRSKMDETGKLKNPEDMEALKEVIESLKQARGSKL
ncbi:MAG: NADPH-dependent FMN reductase [Chitinophagaceae bacterium]